MHRKFTHLNGNDTLEMSRGESHTASKGRGITSTTQAHQYTANTFFFWQRQVEQQLNLEYPTLLRKCELKHNANDMGGWRVEGGWLTAGGEAG